MKYQADKDNKKKRATKKKRRWRPGNKLLS
jgi:hypothetical protein